MLVNEYEIVDHGIEHEQYFQGCGVSFTEFTDIATGCGNDYAEALDDALEMLASNDWDVTEPGERIKQDNCGAVLSTDSVSTRSANASEHEDWDSHHYYLSIRVK